MGWDPILVNNTGRLDLTPTSGNLLGHRILQTALFYEKGRSIDASILKKSLDIYESRLQDNWNLLINTLIFACVVFADG